MPTGDTDDSDEDHSVEEVGAQANGNRSRARQHVGSRAGQAADDARRILTSSGMAERVLGQRTAPVSQSDQTTDVTRRGDLASLHLGASEASGGITLSYERALTLPSSNLTAWRQMLFDLRELADAHILEQHNGPVSLPGTVRYTASHPNLTGGARHRSEPYTNYRKDTTTFSATTMEQRVIIYSLQCPYCLRTWITTRQHAVTGRVEMSIASRSHVSIALSRCSHCNQVFRVMT